MTETKYGVISDVHQNPRIVPLALDILLKEGAEKLLVNGDIGGHYGSLENNKRYTTFILESIAKRDLESFVQPGSHETLLGYEPVIEHFSEKYSNIINVLENKKIEQNGHDLIFLPGSDFLCGGEYQIGAGKLASGKYVLIRERASSFTQFIPLEKFQQLDEQAVNKLKDYFKGVVKYSNMDDLKELVTDPDKTIVVCHVPRKFDNLENCVDMAEFGEASIDFSLNRKIIENGSVFPIDSAGKLAEAGYPIALKKANRGNIYLRRLYEELGINKAISGHFHESAHRANDKNGNRIEEGKMVSELFWMASFLDGLKAGILIVNENKVSYRNINLANYIKV